MRSEDVDEDIEESSTTGSEASFVPSSNGHSTYISQDTEEKPAESIAVPAVPTAPPVQPVPVVQATKSTLKLKPSKAAKVSTPIPEVEDIKPKRPAPAGQPLVWAEKRGALCEALPYFRAYQGSLHSAGVIALGFLMDQEVDQGDVFGAQVVISSV